MMRERVRTNIGQFAMVPLWIVIHPDVGHIAVRLFALLAGRYADRDENTCHPSRRRLAEDLRINSVTTVDTALGQLKTAGALTVTQQHDGAGDLSTSLYTLIFDDPLNNETHSKRTRPVAVLPQEKAH